MDVVTAWVNPPKQIGGLDHLAVQAPCINIYGRLLPGITNVTDRARYYSFYPWLIWALEQAGHSSFDDAFIDAFRKADGLFTLISHQHADISTDAHENHAGATVGSANLSKHIATIRRGEEVLLTDYAHRDSSRQSYFKNKLGGLGQYYLGVLAEFSVLDGSSSSGISYTRQLGLPLIESMDAGVPRELFIEIVQAGKVTAQQLNDLSAFCPCQLPHSKAELDYLLNLFFAQDMFEDIDAAPRRRTLRMLLELSDTLADQNLPLDSNHFRGSVYAKALPDGSPWVLPDDLMSIRSLWGIYERNELLSISIQGLFYALLDAYEDSGLALESGAAVAEWFVNESAELDSISETFGAEDSFDMLVQRSQEWMASYERWGDEFHEVMLAEQIVDLCGGKKSAANRVKIVEAALRTLISLAARSESQSGYDSIVFPGNYLQAYPINLKSFLRVVQHTWGGMKLKELLVWLFSRWGVDTHLRVALRKLRGQSQSTFRVRPSDQGLKVIDIPSAVHTSPRFNQAVRVLKDLNLLESDGTITKCTTLGRKYKEVIDGV